VRKKTLLHELKASGVDFDAQPASFYSKGMEDPCRIGTHNIHDPANPEQRQEQRLQLFSFHSSFNIL